MGPRQCDSTWTSVICFYKIDILMDWMPFLHVFFKLKNLWFSTAVKYDNNMDSLGFPLFTLYDELLSINIKMHLHAM